MRKKLKEEEKKRKMTICIDEKLFDIFENYMLEIGNSNNTKYIEKLIKEDLISRDIIKNNFIE
jgi:hypothetical protein